MIKNRYNEIAEALEIAIKSGTYQERLPGVYRLAEQFSASHITVSKAVKLIARKGFVNIVGTKGAIITYSKEQRPRTNIICLIGNFSEINQNCIPINSIVARAEKKGFKTITFSLHQQNILSDDTFLEAFHADGFIFMYSSLTPDIISKLKQRGIPFVSLNRLPDDYGVHWADHDNGGGWMELLRQLITDGHQWIGCLAELSDDQIHQQMFEHAYRTVLKEQKCFDDKLFAGRFNAGDYKGTNFDDKLKQFIHERIAFFLSLKKRPTALFCKSEKILKIAADFLDSEQVKMTLVTNVEETMLPENRYYPVSVYSERKRAEKAFDVLLKAINTPGSPPIHELVPRQLLSSPQG